MAWGSLHSPELGWGPRAVSGGRSTGDKPFRGLSWEAGRPESGPGLCPLGPAWAAVTLGSCTQGGQRPEARDAGSWGCSSPLAAIALGLGSFVTELG